MTAKRVSIPCGEISLEGELIIPGDEKSYPAVVVCHPHPLHGGDMNNNVVMAVCNALFEKSIASLRFNFRGVGESAGTYGEGVGEQDDVKATLDFISAQPKIDIQQLALIGYSFGGMVALEVAVNDTRVKRLALISPHLKDHEWLTLKKYQNPKLILLGNEDTIVPVNSLRRITGSTKEYRIIQGADHFWFGYEDTMVEMVSDFFSGQSEL